MTTRIERGDVNPQGRVDLLLIRLAQHCTGLLERHIEQRLRVRDVRLWPHVEPIIQSELKRRRVPRRQLNAAELAEYVFSGKAPRRLKCT